MLAGTLDSLEERIEALRTFLRQSKEGSRYLKWAFTSCVSLQLTRLVRTPSLESTVRAVRNISTAVQRQLNELEELDLRLGFNHLKHTTKTTRKAEDGASGHQSDPEILKRAQRAFEARARGKQLQEKLVAQGQVSIVQSLR
jgi:hypothetical protein